MPYLSREWQLYWEDMLEASRRVVRYTRGLDADTFARDDMIRDAVLRNLEVIGEAAKRRNGFQWTFATVIQISNGAASLDSGM